MTNSVGLLHLNDSPRLSQTPLLDSSEPSAQSQEVLQAYCTGMQNRRTVAVKYKKSPLFLLLLQFSSI